MKKTLVQMGENNIVVVDEVVGITQTEDGVIQLLMKGGHRLNVGVESDMTVVDVAAHLFQFDEDEDDSNG